MSIHLASVLEMIALLHHMYVCLHNVGIVLCNSITIQVTSDDGEPNTSITEVCIDKYSLC